MADVDEICQEAMAGALPLGGTGDFIKACRRYLAQRKFPEDKVSIFFSRLSEALLHRGWREHAVECAQIAFKLPAEEATANLCAWVFSNSGHQEEAAAA